MSICSGSMPDSARRVVPKRLVAEALRFSERARAPRSGQPPRVRSRRLLALVSGLSLWLAWPLASFAHGLLMDAETDGHTITGTLYYSNGELAVRELVDLRDLTDANAAPAVDADRRCGAVHVRGRDITSISAVRVRGRGAQRSARSGGGGEREAATPGRVIRHASNGVPPGLGRGRRSAAVVACAHAAVSFLARRSARTVISASAAQVPTTTRKRSACLTQTVTPLPAPYRGLVGDGTTGPG